MKLIKIFKDPKGFEDSEDPEDFYCYVLTFYKFLLLSSSEKCFKYKNKKPFKIL